MDDRAPWLSVTPGAPSRVLDPDSLATTRPSLEIPGKQPQRLLLHREKLEHGGVAGRSGGGSVRGGLELGSTLQGQRRFVLVISFAQALAEIQQGPEHALPLAA